MPLPVRQTLLKNTANHCVIFFNATDSETLTDFLITGNNITNAHSGTGGTVPVLGGGGSNPYANAGSHLTGYHFDTSDANIQPPPTVFNEQPRRIKSVEFMHCPGLFQGNEKSLQSAELRFADGTGNQHRAWIYSGGNNGTNQAAMFRRPDTGRNRKFTFDPPLQSPLTGDSWALLLKATPLQKSAGGKSTTTADEFTLSGIIELVK